MGGIHKWLAYFAMPCRERCHIGTWFIGSLVPRLSPPNSSLVPRLSTPFGVRVVYRQLTPKCPRIDSGMAHELKELFGET